MLSPAFATSDPRRRLFAIFGLGVAAAALVVPALLLAGLLPALFVLALIAAAARLCLGRFLRALLRCGAFRLLALRCLALRGLLTLRSALGVGALSLPAVRYLAVVLFLRLSPGALLLLGPLGLRSLLAPLS